jgi:hypothetical protein
MLIREEEKSIYLVLVVACSVFEFDDDAEILVSRFAKLATERTKEIRKGNENGEGGTTVAEY